MIESGWYFTEPWNPVLVRRGDALGLRAGSDYFADLLAPGLSNSTSDARWISILSWCLQWSHVAWYKAGGGDLARRDAQRARYAWLRPLELLWIDRTLASGQETGQLRGRRSIERWRGKNRGSSNFTMSQEQFLRYRQVGTYGAYRVAFRALPGLTMNGDGWTPGEAALKLSELVNKSLPSPAQLDEEGFRSRTQWGGWVDKETEYWTKRGWQGWLETPKRGFLPTAANAIDRPLPEAERKILSETLFSDDSIRHCTVAILAKARKKDTHADLCDALAASSALAARMKPASLDPLPAFTRLADAGMHAMREVWNKIRRDNTTSTPNIEKLAKNPEIRENLENLHEASMSWLRAPGRSEFRHEHVATRLAEAMKNASTTTAQLRALSKHHAEYGGGRRWFAEQAGKFELQVDDTGIVAADYRFRLSSLALLASQCGIAGVGNALESVSRQNSDDEGGDSL